MGRLALKKQRGSDGGVASGVSIAHLLSDLHSEIWRDIGDSRAQLAHLLSDLHSRNNAGQTAGVASGVFSAHLLSDLRSRTQQTVCGVTCTQETDLVVWKQELPAIKTRRPALVTRSHNPVTHRPLPSTTHTSEFPGSIPRQFGLDLHNPARSSKFHVLIPLGESLGNFVLGAPRVLWRLKLQMAQASRILPPGHLLGHYSNKNELYSVHWGSPDVIRQTPSPLQAPPINHEVWIPRFRELRYLSLEFPYLLFVPTRNPWHTPLFHSFNRIRYKIPIVSHKDDGFRLAPEVANHWVDTERCLRVLGRELLRLVPHKRWMDRINPWFFPGRFQFLRCFETEKKARFAVWLSMENFLPLLGYVAMGLWLLQSETSEALYRGEDPPDWRGQVIEKTGLHPSFLEYAEQSVNWQEERVGAIYRIESPQDLTPEQREQCLEVESMLASIMRSTFPIPIYLSWGKLPQHMILNMLDVPEPLQDFAPGPRVLESLYVHEGRRPRSGSLFRTSATPIAPNHEPSAPAVPAAPFPRLPPNSQQKKGETIQAFFIRRSEGNRNKMAKESPVDRQRRTSRAAHAQKGGVPSKGSVFLWEKVDGHYIRQPQIRGEFPDLWDEYPGPQRRFDPFHNEWDLSPDSDDEIDATDAIFPQNIDMASRLAPTDTSPNVDTNMEIVHEEHPRNAVQEHPSRRQEHSNFEFEFLNGDYRDLAKASKECMSLVFLKFGMAPRTEDPEYEPVAANLLDALYKRFGFTMPPSPDTIDVRDPPEERLEPKHLANVIGMADIANQLASDKALQNILCTFFGHPQRPKAAPTGFTINREYLTSMRNPAEQMYYYVLAEDGSGIGSEVLLFPRATDVLEPPNHAKVNPSSGGPAAQGFQRRTPHGEIYQLLHTPLRAHGHAVRRGGGGGWRAWRGQKVSDDDFFRGFDDDIYDVGDCLWDETSKTRVIGTTGLSDHEIDLLCGVYHVGTGQKRQASGKGKVQGQYRLMVAQTKCVGAWKSRWVVVDATNAMNDFFAKRLGHFAKGVFVLLRQSQWRSNLKFRKEVKKCWDGVEIVADSVVRGVVTSHNNLDLDPTTISSLSVDHLAGVQSSLKLRDVFYHCFSDTWLDPRVDAALRSSQVDELQNYPPTLRERASIVVTTSPGGPGGLGGMDSLLPVDSAALVRTSLTSRPAPGVFWAFSYSTPPTFIATAQGSRAQCITAISSFCSTNSSHSRPRLPGAVDYTIKLLLHQLFSQPPKAPGRSGLHLFQAFAPPTLLTAAQGSRAQWITLISSFANPRSRVRLHSAFEVQLHAFAQFIPSHHKHRSTNASPSSILLPSKAGTILGDCADSARDKDDVLAMRPACAISDGLGALGPVTSALKNRRELTDFLRETRVPGAHGTNPAALGIGG
ncbi:hypothetical protein B0H14DRAFT_2638850 [Mycena olivaceomarginata]|nr:hypothetical protein B0H14DRAFT_2638850 [Mycena olivaceomarginata]